MSRVKLKVFRFICCSDVQNRLMAIDVCFLKKTQDPVFGRRTISRVKSAPDAWFHDRPAAGSRPPPCLATPPPSVIGGEKINPRHPRGGALNKEDPDMAAGRPRCRLLLALITFIHPDVLEKGGSRCTPTGGLSKGGLRPLVSHGDGHFPSPLFTSPALFDIKSASNTLFKTSLLFSFFVSFKL